MLFYPRYVAQEITNLMCVMTHFKPPMITVFKIKLRTSPFLGDTCKVIAKTEERGVSKHIKIHSVNFQSCRLFGPNHNPRIPLGLDGPH